MHFLTANNIFRHISFIQCETNIVLSGISLLNAQSSLFYPQGLAVFDCRLYSGTGV